MNLSNLGKEFFFRAVMSTGKLLSSQQLYGNRLSDQWSVAHVSRAMLEVIDTFSARTLCSTASVSIPEQDRGCTVWWQVWKDRGSHQGDIIACKVVSVGEVTHVRPHISGKHVEDRALICTTNSQTSLAAHACFTAVYYFLEVYYCTKSWTPLCLCVFTPAIIFLLSAVCTKWTNHTKAKSWQRLFYIAKRLHNLILNVLCTHPCSH